MGPTRNGVKMRFETSKNDKDLSKEEWNTRSQASLS
jgi:hypothetical protein